MIERIPNRDGDHELAELLAAMVEGELDVTQHGRLAELVGKDQDTLDWYADYMINHALLRAKQVPPIASTQPAADITLPASPPSSPRSKSWLNRASRHPKVPSIAIAVAVMAAVILAAAVTPVRQWLAGSGDGKDELTPAEKPEYVAILNNRHNAVWLEGTRPPLRDPRLKVGRRLALASGLAEITYNTGARVVLEGPAEFVVGWAKGEGEGQHALGGNPANDDAPFVLPPPHNSGYLAHGKLVARVEGEEAKGFVVATPTAQVEDLGTEFAVEVDRMGASSVLVYSGEIRVKHADQTVRVLMRGQAIYATRESFGGDEFSLDNAHFVRKILPNRIDLAQVVAGRDGTGDARARRDDVVPFAEEQQFAHAAVNRYSAVRSNPLVDGVFIPDGGAADKIVVSTTGVTVRGIADSNGRTYDFVRSGPNLRVLDVTLDGYDYLTGRRSLIGMHANKGITFDLNAVRRMLPESRIERFVARAGNTRGSVDFYVLLDGKVEFQSLGHVSSPDTLSIDIEIPDSARLLTLITTDAGDGDAMDWSVFTEPQLRLGVKTDVAEDDSPVETEQEDLTKLNTGIPPG